MGLTGYVHRELEAELKHCEKAREEKKNLARRKVQGMSQKWNENNDLVRSHAAVYVAESGTNDRCVLTVGGESGRDQAEARQLEEDGKDAPAGHQEAPEEHRGRRETPRQPPQD